MGRGSRWRALSLVVRRRDGNRCQTCGDIAPIKYSPYGSPHAHHIKPRSKGGPDRLSNLITLCNLCHAVLHPHLWPSWFPQVLDKDEGKRIEALSTLHETRKAFEWFCRLPPRRRSQVQVQVWTG